MLTYRVNMVTESVLQTIIDGLKEGKNTTIRLLGNLIEVKSCANSSKLWLSTVIYDGGNYIPSSVRNTLQSPSPVPRSPIPTFVTVDESKFQLVLNYLGLLPEDGPQQFKDLLEQFAWDAEEWRYYLDDFDKRDLIRVPIH